MMKLIVPVIVGVFVLLIVLYPDTMLSPGKLVQGHEDLNEKCLSCHTPFGGIANDKCISCHQLSEIGKDTLTFNDNKKKVLFHQNLSGQACSSCHSDHKGLNPETSLISFKHEMLAATLINNCVSCHAKPSDKLHTQLTANCKSCHNTDGWKLAGPFNHDMLQGTEKNNCAGCHTKPSDKLHTQLTANCQSCHNTNDWKLAGPFNHDMLQGAEKNNCAGCHQNPKDAFHATIKDNCDKCHSTSKWVPSSFNHAAYFQLDGDHNARCTVCHLNNNFSTYTCYGCHEHSESNIRGEHLEEGITNFTNCVSCHRSGDEDDARENGNQGGKNERKGSNKSDDDDN